MSLTGDDGGDVPDTAVTSTHVHVGHGVDRDELDTWTGHCHIAQVADVHREWAVCGEWEGESAQAHVGVVLVVIFIQTICMWLCCQCDRSGRWLQLTNVKNRNHTHTKYTQTHTHKTQTNTLNTH